MAYFRRCIDGTVNGGRAGTRGRGHGTGTGGLAETEIICSPTPAITGDLRPYPIMGITSGVENGEIGSGTD
jgi:hypothetical protein